jgi:hypothetical protein
MSPYDPQSVFTRKLPHTLLSKKLVTHYLPNFKDFVYAFKAFRRLNVYEAEEIRS